MTSSNYHASVESGDFRLLPATAWASIYADFGGKASQRCTTMQNFGALPATALARFWPQEAPRRLEDFHLLPSMCSNLAYRIPNDQIGMFEAQKVTTGERLGVFPTGTAGTEATEEQKLQPEVASGGLGLFDGDTAVTADTAECIDDYQESKEACIQSLLISCFEDISQLSDKNRKPKGEASSSGNHCNPSCGKEYSEEDMHLLLEDMEKVIHDMGESTKDSSSSALFAGHGARKTPSASQAMAEQTHLARLQAQKSLGYVKEKSETVRQIPERLLQMLRHIHKNAESQAADGKGPDSLAAATHGKACTDEDERKVRAEEVEDLLMSCSEDVCKGNHEIITPKAEPSSNFGFADLSVWKKLSAGQMVSGQAHKAKVQMQRSIEYMKEQRESVLRMPEQIQRYSAETAETAREKARAVSATATQSVSQSTKKVLGMAMSMRAAQFTPRRGGA